MSLDEFRKAITKEGLTYDKYREEIRKEIVIQRLRDREVDQRISVSDVEVDAFLASQEAQAGGDIEYKVSHILVLVPDRASPDQIDAKRRRAEEALKQVKDGTDFAQVAAGFSDAQDALQGGSLGWRAPARMPANDAAPSSVVPVRVQTATGKPKRANTSATGAPIDPAPITPTANSDSEAGGGRFQRAARCCVSNRGNSRKWRRAVSATYCAMRVPCSASTARVIATRAGKSGVPSNSSTPAPAQPTKRSAGNRGAMPAAILNARIASISAGGADAGSVKTISRGASVRSAAS